MNAIETYYTRGNYCDEYIYIYMYICRNICSVEKSNHYQGIYHIWYTYVFIIECLEEVNNVLQHGRKDKLHGNMSLDKREIMFGIPTITFSLSRELKGV